MKNLFYILILSIVWSSSFSQSFKQGQLYAVPSEGVKDIIFNTSLNISFVHADDFAAKANPDHFASLENLAIYLTQRFDDEKSKVRSIYTWVALNIIYDQNIILGCSKNNQSAQNVWNTKVAVCEGYANLFHEMCVKAGIESRLIKGYVKRFSGNDLRFPNHAWNSVKIDGKWQLLDVTWASVNNEDDKKALGINDNYAKRKLDHYFLVNPKRMILTHLPEDPYWQLQNNYVSIDIYQKGEACIKEALRNPYTEEIDFEDLISNFERLDSLDRSISFLERMEQNKWNKTKEYGLGIAYFYKAQKILKESYTSPSKDLKKSKQLAKAYYKKSLDHLAQVQENDYGYEFSINLANNVAFRMEVLQ